MWDNDKKLLVQKMIYQDMKDAILKNIQKIEDSEILYVFSYNYNWDDGFEIPNAILSNKYCELSTALLIFYNSGGFEYLNGEIDEIRATKESVEFLKILYENIKSSKYAKGHIRFVPPLTKVQLYKLKKLLSEDEEVFITTINGADMDINV